MAEKKRPGIPTQEQWPVWMDFHRDMAIHHLCWFSDAEMQDIVRIAIETRDGDLRYLDYLNERDRRRNSSEVAEAIEKARRCAEREMEEGATLEK